MNVRIVSSRVSPFTADEVWVGFWYSIVTAPKRFAAAVKEENVLEEGSKNKSVISLFFNGFGYVPRFTCPAIRFARPKTVSSEALSN